MIDKELLMIIAMTVSPLLFMLGGWKWKWMRRFLLPVVLGGLVVLSGAEWWRCAAMASLMIGVFCLPYGERTPYWGKFLVGCLFVAPTLFIGFNIWQIITPIIFIAMFWLSNSSFWGRMFPWKIVEGTTGFLIGVTVSQLISSS